MITFHDPCYLGRHNGIVEEPRQALLETNAFVLEMPRHGKQSFCCGAGGAQMWKEEEHGTRRQRDPLPGSRRHRRQDHRRRLPLLPDDDDRRLQGGPWAREDIKVKDVREIIAETAAATPIAAPEQPAGGWTPANWPSPT
jgi:hypothetical protein